MSITYWMQFWSHCKTCYSVFENGIWHPLKGHRGKAIKAFTCLFPSNWPLKWWLSYTELQQKEAEVQYKEKKQPKNTTVGARDPINTKLDFCSRDLSFSRRYYLSSRWIRFLLIHHSVNCSISHGEAEVKKRAGTGIFNYCNYSGRALESLLRSRTRRSGRSSPGTTDPSSTEGTSQT